jgi:hypothetical protein
MTGAPLLPPELPPSIIDRSLPHDTEPPLPGDARPAALDDELRRALSGPAWHGPSVDEALAGVTAAEAAAYPIAGAHSIWELVGHLATWVRVPRRRLTSDTPIPAPTGAGDFPPAPPAPDESAWRAVVDDLHREVDLLRALVRGLPPAALDDIPPGHDVPAAVILHGVAQHLAYHGGQIALLRRALGGGR